MPLGYIQIRGTSSTHFNIKILLEDDDDDGDGILDLDEDYDVRDNLNNLFLGLSTSFLRNFKMLLAPRIFRQI